MNLKINQKQNYKTIIRKWDYFEIVENLPNETATILNMLR